MKPRTYKILSDCVEEGIRYGYTRAHKHTDDPDRDTMMGEIHSAIMLSIDQNFSFDDEIPELE